MAWFSFHGGHSGEFCRHASGSLAEVLESAVARGFGVYGVSEHAPRERVEDLYSDERDLLPADLARIFQAYVERAARLREEFAGRLEVLVGFETEMVPPDGWLESMRALRAGSSFDYLVGSVHHVEGIGIDVSEQESARAAERVGGGDALRCAYFDHLASMASGLRPTIVGHFDLIRKFDGASPTFGVDAWKAIERALEAVREAGSLLDVNSAPARRRLGPPYPLPEILERARQMGIGVTLGDDSHGPADVGVGLETCLEAIALAGYREVTCLRRRAGETSAEAVPLEEVGPA